MSKIVSREILGLLEGESPAVGEASKSIREVELQLIEHYQEPFSRQWSQPQQRFMILKRKWLDETEMLSGTPEICMNLNYQQIIGMGEIALPFIFADLSSNLQHWFWALRCITGVDPVSQEDRGSLEKMRQVWLKWARDEGYLG